MRNSSPLSHSPGGSSGCFIEEGSKEPLKDSHPTTQRSSAPRGSVLPFSQRVRLESATNPALRNTVVVPKHRGTTEEEAVQEVHSYVLHCGGRANIVDISAATAWDERFAAVCGPLWQFCENRPVVFAISATRDTITLMSTSTHPEVTIGATKRQVPAAVVKKRQRQTPSYHGKLAYLCLCRSISLEGLERHFRQLDYSCSLVCGVLHVTNVKGYGSTISTAEPIARFDLFVFAYGSVVWWGTDIDTFRVVECTFLNPKDGLKSILCDRYPYDIVRSYFPVWCTFSVVHEGAAKQVMEGGEFLAAMQRDHLLLQSDRPAFKQTISHALAQSAKLDVIEPMVGNLVKICRPLPQQIRETGQAEITSTRVNQLKGELFLYRMALKSDSELLDEPDFFWDNPWFHPLFKVVRDEYGIEMRAQLLDEKLTAVQMTLSMIGEQYNRTNESRIEWIIIILILLELVLAIVELFLQTYIKK